MPTATTSSTSKVRENKLRRMAERQRLQLVKNRRRDPRAWDYGGYALVAWDSNAAVFGFGPTGTPTATPDDIEAYLTGDES